MTRLIETSLEIPSISELVLFSEKRIKDRSRDLDVKLETRQVQVQEKNIEDLDLYKMGICKLPEDWGCFEKLCTLKLIRNNLEELPKGILVLSALKYLYLMDNFLKTLPEDISRLTSLKELYVSHNDLEKLPETICDMVNLTHLEVNNNRLQTVPEKIWQLTSLRCLYLHNNKYSSLYYDGGGTRIVPERQNDLKTLPPLPTLPYRGCQTWFEVQLRLELVVFRNKN